MKIGSLFDGSGGFPLAGYKNGFTPVWASDVMRRIAKELARSKGGNESP